MDSHFPILSSDHQNQTPFIFTNTLVYACACVYIYKERERENIPMSRSNLGTPSSGKARSSSALSDSFACFNIIIKHQHKPNSPTPQIQQNTFTHPPLYHSRPTPLSIFRNQTQNNTQYVVQRLILSTYLIIIFYDFLSNQTEREQKKGT